MGYVLYKLAPGWGLPSLSPACIQAEVAIRIIDIEEFGPECVIVYNLALLRFTGAQFTAQSANEPGKSPSGCLPCLENGDGMADTSHETDDFGASREVIEFMKKQGDDADGPLSNSQKAMSGALTRLVQSDLEPATLYSAWVETEGYREYRKAFAGGLPFPLNHLVPLEKRYNIRKSLKNTTPDQVYGAAEAAIDSIADFLNGTDSPFCFGEAPCTLDAMLYGHLLFYNLAPVAAPVMKKKIDEHTNLRRYVDRISSQYFSEVAPVPPVRTWVEDLDDATSSWSQAAQGNKPEEEKPKKREDTPEDKQLKKWGKVWLGCAAAVLAAYIWYYPPPIQIISVGDMDDDDEDGLD